MNMTLLRIILLLAAAGRTQLTKLAEEIGWARVTVYRRLVWRDSDLDLPAITTLLGVLGMDLGQVHGDLAISEYALGQAIRVFALDISMDDLRDVMGAGAASTVTGQWVSSQDGRLVLARRAG